MKKTKGISFTEKQGQYLAFIFYYTKINGRPPAEADMQRYFKVTPPTINQMVKNWRALALFRERQVLEEVLNSLSQQMKFQFYNEPYL